jgi:hypothetical protein
MTDEARYEVVTLKKFGRALVTRDRGKRVRSSIEEVLGRGGNVTIDFTGVEIATPSFVDETIGWVAETHGMEYFRKHVRVAGADDSTKHLIKVVLANSVRANQQKDARAKT